MQVEINATFKSCNVKDKTVLQFELSPANLSKLPELTKMVNGPVVLFIENAQTELPLDVEYEEEPEENQEEIPFEDEYEIMDEMALPAGEEDDDEDYE